MKTAGGVLGTDLHSRHEAGELFDVLCSAIAKVAIPVLH